MSSHTIPEQRRAEFGLGFVRLPSVSRPGVTVTLSYSNWRVASAPDTAEEALQPERLAKMRYEVGPERRPCTIADLFGSDSVSFY